MMSKHVPSSSLVADKSFSKKGYQVPRNKIGVIPQGRGVGSGVRKGAAKDATEAW
jgi:hypothetical protein